MCRISGVIAGIAVLLIGCAPLAPKPASPTAPGNWLTYHNKDAGFSIRYPPTWQELPDPVVEGGLIIFASSAASGNLLINKEMAISVNNFPSDCQWPNAEKAVVNGVSFLTAWSSDGAGGGEIFEGPSYSVVKDGKCIHLSFDLHYVKQFGNATEPALFDKAAESAIFDQILNTFRFDK